SLSTGHTTIAATLGGISGETELSVTPATLVSISVTPTNPSIALGTTQVFTATGTFSDSTTENPTDPRAGNASDPRVATESNAALSLGLGTSLATGHATITATLGGISGDTGLSVTAATLVSIEVTPTNPSIALGTTQAFTATGVFFDSTTE